MYYKVTNDLSKCQDAILLRKAVFIDEQKFNKEFDDYDKKSIHVVAYKNKKPVATARYYKDENGAYHIGRVAVDKNFRGQHIGEKIIYFCEQRILDLGGKVILISAQERVKNFYKKLGYKEYGEPYMEEHVSHINMKKEFGKN